MSLLVDTSLVMEPHRKRKYIDGDKSHKIIRLFQHSNPKLSRSFAPLNHDDENLVHKVANKLEDDGILPEQSVELTRTLDVLSPQAITMIDKKYPPPPKIRKCVTMTRNFPPNCGEDCATFSNVVVTMENGKANSETEQCNVKEESNDKLSSLFDGGNLVNYENKSNQVTCTPSKNFQDFDWEEDWRRNDLEINTITTQGEVEKDQCQLGSQNRNKFNAGVDLVMCSDDEDGDYSMDENSGKDLAIVPYDAAGKGGEEPIVASNNQVQEALKLFKELYGKLYREYKAESKGGRMTRQIHIEAAMKLRNEQKWVNMETKFGPVPGVEVGDTFKFRAQLALVGLHHELISGINCVTINGKKHANSVVDSGRYDNKVLSRDVILYCGQGGNPKVQFQRLSEDQKLEGANLALKRSMDAKLPIRVIRKIGRWINNNDTNNKIYLYEGLYRIRNFWQEKKNPTEKLVFMFEMVRVSGQQETSTGYFEQSNETSDDLSQGKEKIPITVVNDFSGGGGGGDGDKPQPFTYITEMKYPPDWNRSCEPIGCDCTDACSDYEPCYCAHKNGGEIPFNEQGSIIKAKRLVHECGPQCKCPPSCQNRVSQRGIRFQLEVFKTNSTGWGVRCREDIPSGSFICEYIGELLDDKEAEKRSNDEYLFDLDNCNGFTIDAAEYGNVGRFINHSCSPNLYAQNVVYDNNNQRLPHIMLFASKKIPAFQELSYDYNYKVDRVCDSKGNIKKKICHCGSRKCTGRMY